MNGFTPTAESHGFSPDLLWLGLRGIPNSGDIILNYVDIELPPFQEVRW